MPKFKGRNKGWGSWYVNAKFGTNLS
jgi:hypothetical protein